MSGFQRTATAGVDVYTGTPDCDAAHVALLKGLRMLKTPFVNPTDTISVSQRGNLGEFICLHIARAGHFGTMEKFAQNAIQPLSAISGAGLDLTYVYFDPLNSDNDRLYIQEIKTTGAPNLSYLGNLVGDYKKLFSTDINLSLQTRIQNLANAFEIERNNDEYAERVQRLGATTPQQCSRVRLVPTGVHQLGVGNTVHKMAAVKSSIASFGWDSGSITPWSIALTDLEDRLLRLARGQI